MHTQWKGFLTVFPATGNKILRSKKIHFLLQEKNFLAAKKNFPRSKERNSAQQGKRFCAARIFLSCYTDFLAYELWDFPIHKLRDLLE